MTDLKIQQQKINKFLEDIIDSSKTRSSKLSEEKIMIKRLVKEVNNFRKQTKHKKKTKTKVHLKQLVSSDVYEFMGINTIIKLSKSDVMQYICNYIKEKGLQCANNKRYFTTNKELSKLFRVKFKSYLSIIEIMKYIHPHFDEANIVKVTNYYKNKKTTMDAINDINDMNNDINSDIEIEYED